MLLCGCGCFGNVLELCFFIANISACALVVAHMLLCEGIVVVISNIVAYLCG